MILSSIRNHIKWVLALFVVIFVVSIFFTYGVGRRGGSSKGVHDHAVAEIDGKKLFLSDLYKQAQVFAQNQGININPENAGEVYHATVDSLARRVAIDHEIKKRGIGVSEEAVKAKLKELEARYVTKEAFLQNLQATGQTLDDVKASLARQLKVEELFNQAVQVGEPTDEDLHKLYDMFHTMKHPLVFKGKGIEGHHVEFADQATAKEFAQAVRNGEAWSDLLTRYGDKVGVHSTGKALAYISDEELQQYPDLVKLADGDVCDPVALSGDNWLVFQRVHATGESFERFERVRDELVRVWKSNETRIKQAAFMEDLSKSVEVKILDPEAFKPQMKEKDVADDQAKDQAGEPAKDQVSDQPAETDQPAVEQPQPAEQPKEQPQPTDAPKPQSKVDGGVKVAGAKVQGGSFKEKINFVPDLKKNGGLVAAKTHATQQTLPALPSCAGERKTAGKGH